MPGCWIFVKRANAVFVIAQPAAFYDQPIQHDNGLVTVLDNGRCFPYFAKNHGCSVCIKVCPFNRQGYDKIKEGFFSPNTVNSGAL